MKCFKSILVFFMALPFCGHIQAQNILTVEEVVTRALENNFDIQLAKNASEIAKNNASKNNTGKLPTVGVNAGYNFRLDNTTANFQDGRSTSLTLAPSQGLNASINAGYNIFDGFFRKYNIKQLEEQYSLSRIAVEAAMENIAAQTISQYYQIAALVSNLETAEEAIVISNRRLERANQKFEFGQGSRLDILNATVDLNNDSLTYFNTEIQIDNSKRLLNNLLVDQETLDYNVETETEFIPALSKELLQENMLRENLALSQLDKNIEIGNLSIDLANARKLPTIRGDLSYGYNYNKNNSASFLSSANSNGLNAGLSLTWNIFDGGQTKYALENARITNEGLAIQREQLRENLELQFETAWANYQDRLFIYQNQQKNVEINYTNFERTEEQFKIGQISSVDYRQAQLNLSSAVIALNSSKFQVKIAEVELLLLSGGILD